jgi:hypothetical protein
MEKENHENDCRKKSEKPKVEPFSAWAAAEKVGDGTPVGTWLYRRIPTPAILPAGVTSFSAVGGG